MRPLDILISGERVESLLPRGSEVRADRVIDASGRYVLPGIIDAHNHPVYADRIDCLSRAALSGGVTTVIPYIGAVAAWGKQGGLVQAIDDFIREGETGSCIDFGLHCTLTANVMEEADEAIPELVARGVISFKAFTSYRKRGMKLEDDQIDLLQALQPYAGHVRNVAFFRYSTPLPGLSSVEKALGMRIKEHLYGSKNEMHLRLIQLDPADVELFVARGTLVCQWATAAGFPTLEIDLAFDEAIEAAKRLSPDTCDVVLSRGVTVDVVKQNSSIPVVPIDFSAWDRSGVRHPGTYRRPYAGV